MSTENITVRASSWPDLMDCPARWYAKNIENKYTPSGPAALIGTALAKSSAVFDESRMEGRGITIDESAGAAVDALRHPEHDVDWDEEGSKWTEKEAEATTVALHTMYCREISPKRTFVAVEKNLGRVEIEVPEHSVTVAITGSTDRIRSKDGKLGVCDMKSGKTAVSADGRVKTQGFAPQLAAYSLLSRTVNKEPLELPAEIFGLQTGKTAKGQRVAVGECEKVEEIILGTSEKPGMIHVVAAYARMGMFPGNPKSMLCSEKFCAVYKSCHFRR